MPDDYYIAESGENKGLYSKAQLKSMWDQGLITSDTQYRTERMDDWYLLSTLLDPKEGQDLAPQREAQKTDTYDPHSTSPLKCPKCATHIAPEARACPACQFSIWEYNQNKAEAKKAEMNRVRGDEGDYLRELRKKASYQSPGGAICVILCGIIGSYFGLGLLSYGIVVVGFVLLFLSGLGGHRDEENKAIASARAQNTYDHVTCPTCGSTLATPNATISWPSEGGWVDCDRCNKRSVRIKDILLYVPHSEVSLTGSLGEYLESATEPQPSVVEIPVPAQAAASTQPAPFESTGWKVILTGLLIVVIAGFFLLRLFQNPATDKPASAEATPYSPLRWLRVTQPVQITLRDGFRMWIDYGETVQLVSEDGPNVRIRYAGEECEIPASATDLK